MPKPINQMLASLIAAKLEDELVALDAADGTVSVFHATSRVLHPNDQKALIAAARTRLAKFRKEAAGCPSRVFTWQEFFASK